MVSLNLRRLKGDVVVVRENPEGGWDVEVTDTDQDSFKALTVITGELRQVDRAVIQIIAARGLNIRMGPGASYEDVGNAPFGSIYEVIETKEVGGTYPTWLKIEGGWIAEGTSGGSMFVKYL